MMIKKKIIALALSIAAVCSFAGCAEKEETKTDKPADEIVSEETENTETAENGVVGTWVVEKHEAYDSPLKQMAEEMLDVYYYEGSEHTFKADGTFESGDGKIKLTYKVISDTQMSWVDVNTGVENINDYVLSGDELILYGNYTGDYAHLGYSNATYLKRK